VFIETNDRFALGQKVAMSFKLPGYAEPLALKGRITRSGILGMGVNFSGLSPNQNTLIRTFIENKQ
jgi:Tfp pilus assembly protein PilZ